MADNRAAELIVDLEEQLVACLVSVSAVDRQAAKVAAKQVSQHISKHWGGQLCISPKSGGVLSERDKEIWAKFNGSNHAALAQQYDLSMQQIYAIVREAMAIARAKTQQDLFAG